jgi:hypothetical protein
MNKRRASKQKRRPSGGKKRKEAAVEYEYVEVFSKRMGRGVMISRPVRPSPSPKKVDISEPSTSRAQSTNSEASSFSRAQSINSRASSFSTEAMSDVFTEDSIGQSGWYLEDDIVGENISISQKKSGQGKVRSWHIVIGQA